MQDSSLTPLDLEACHMARADLAPLAHVPANGANNPTKRVTKTPRESSRRRSRPSSASPRRFVTTMEEATALLSPPGNKKSADQHVDESRQSHHKNKREASFPVSLWPYRF
jgi:hypothetical protein